MRALPLVWALGACAQREQPLEDEIAAIVERCDAPSSSVELMAGGEIRLQPDPEAPYHQVDCLLRELRASGRLKNLPMGFVGNELPNAVEER